MLELALQICDIIEQSSFPGDLQMPHDPPFDPQPTVDFEGTAESHRTIDRQPAPVEPSTLDQAKGFDPAPPTAPSIAGISGAGQSIPGYTITGEIARGGMGRVLAGREMTLDREVALKLLLPGASSERFVTESKITAKLPHPNIPPVYALGTLDDGSPYLAMKRIRGRTLAEELAVRPGPSDDLPRFVTVFEQIAQAVGFAHAQGIIHRDLKPANIMLGAFGEVQVMDWGLAKDLANDLEISRGHHPESLVAAEHTAAGAVMGTPAYMAPEQARGEAVDARADVFALGGILTGILTGQAVFTGKSALETIDQAARADTAAAFARIDACGAETELKAIAKHCLAANSAERPADGHEVASLIASYRAGVEERLRRAEAEQAAAATKAQEQRKRRRLLLIASASVFAVLLLGVVGTTMGLIQANRARESEAQRADSESQARQEADRQKEIAVKAANAERLANEQAQRRLAQIEKGVDFLASILKGINPRSEELGGAPLYQQLVERVSQAADDLDADLIGDTLAVARLQTILGDTLLELGDADKAEKILLKARSIREQGLGPDHYETLYTLHTLAGAYRETGKISLAIELFEQVRKSKVNKLGADHAATLATMHNLARAYHEGGNIREAIALFESVRDANVQRLGADHPNTLTTLGNLARAYLDAGMHTEAVALYEQVRNTSLRTLGADHITTLNATHNLADAYQQDRREAESIALLEQVRDGQTVKLGAKHPATLTTQANLANAHRSAGRLAEAIALYRQVLADLGQKLGVEHPSTLAVQGNLAGAYRETGKIADAIELYEQIREIRVRNQGIDHPHTLAILGNLADAYRLAGQPPEAIALYEQVCHGRIKTLGVNHPHTLLSMSTLARAYLAVGKWDEAIGLIQQVYDVSEAERGNDHAETLSALHLLAGTYRAAGRLTDAIGAYEQVHERKSRTLGSDHPSTLTSLGNLAEAYRAADRMDVALPLLEQAAVAVEARNFTHLHAKAIIRDAIDAYETASQFSAAETWRRKWLAVVKQRSGSESPEYLEQVAGLGQNLLKQQKWSAAETLLREGLTLAEQQQPDAWTAFHIMAVLGSSLLGQEKYAEAEPLLVNGYQGLKAREKSIPEMNQALVIAETLDRLIALAQATNNSEQLQKWQAERAKSSEPKATP